MVKKWDNEQDFKIETLAGKYNTRYLASELGRSKTSIKRRLKRIGVSQKENIEAQGYLTKESFIKEFKISKEFFDILVKYNFIKKQKKTINNFFTLISEKDTEKTRELFKNYLNIKECAEKLHISKETLYKSVKNIGKEHIVRLGKMIFIKETFLKNELEHLNNLNTNYYSVKELSKIMNYSQSNIYVYIKNKNIPYMKENNKIYVKKTDIKLTTVI